MKRHLTTDEINYILKDLESNSPKLIPLVMEFVMKIVKDSLQTQLRKVKVYPQIIDKIKANVEKEYMKSLVSAGEMVGVLCAQSMESFTQMTLNMFHSAGLSEKNVSLGLPRFEEILNTTSNPRIIGFTFYPNRKFSSSIRLRDCTKLPYITIAYILQKFKIDNNVSAEPWYSSYLFIRDSKGGDSYKKFDYRLRLTFSSKKMYRNNITPMEIVSIIEKDTSAFCIPSPFTEITVEECIIDVFTSEDIKDSLLRNILELYVSGMHGVEAVYPKEVSETEWILEGNGGSLIDLLSHPLSDSTRTINDNMWDIYHCLGIEATRLFLKREFTKVMSFDGTFVNPKHIALIVDRMTIDGTLSSVNRYGMTREQYQPFAKAAFEETILNLSCSAIHGEVDDTRGVASSIITGKSAKIGTEKCELLVNFDMLTDIVEEMPEMIEF